jgi:sialate O-acetylesterase
VTFNNFVIAAKLLTNNQYSFIRERKSKMDAGKNLKQTGNLLLVIFVLTLTCSARANVRLPHIISDNMVLQRDKELPVWGWADAGEKVTVDFAGNSITATTNEDSCWNVKLPPQKAGGPFSMTIKGNNSLQVKNVLVGDVWLCSGQSNMELQMVNTNNAAKDIAESNYPMIRIISIPRKTAGLARMDVNAEWKLCQPETVYNFSAVAYFFGRKIHKELNVPIGLINSSWGGSRIEPWTPPAGFLLTEKTKDIDSFIEKVNADYRSQVEKSLGNIEEWLKKTKQAIAENKPLPPEPDMPKHFLDDYRQPTGIYNAMIYPLKPFALCGAIWYQGEANLDDGMLYLDKMKTLVGGWRKVWGQGDFPFYFVQLAPYKYSGVPNRLPVIWQAQVAAISEIPNTGMTVTVDLVDNINDIHPRNKKDVGERLALWALAKTYGQNNPVYSGPIYKSMKIEDRKIRIEFDYTGTGLMTKDGKELSCFEIAGDNKIFVKADAVINKDTVVVSSESVEKPTAVRFAWSDTSQPNLCNKEGLPASPFNTNK